MRKKASKNLRQGHTMRPEEAIIQDQ